MAEDYECVVVGGGVIGLSVARELALRGHGVLLLERHAGIGAETSSHNSGVIHAGIYYPQGSLKAKLCVAGRGALYAFCHRHGVSCKKTGKLIVATDEAQLAALQTLYEKGLANGVGDLALLGEEEAQMLEPGLRCVAAISSPSSGIIDVHDYMLALQGEAEQRGAQCVFNTPVERMEKVSGGFIVHSAGTKIHCKALVNAAGLNAAALAGTMEGFPQALLPELKLAKGNYFVHSGKVTFERLIYPLPDAGGLGIHLTLDLGGQARFGPDVEWIDKIDYNVDPSRAEAFYDSVRSFWPGLQDGALAPGYAGIRPKIKMAGEIFRDFLISGPRDHGFDGLVNLFGIESPGLTASLAMGEHVSTMIAA